MRIKIELTSLRERFTKSYQGSDDRNHILNIALELAFEGGVHRQRRGWVEF
jgi:hypothetical protein